MFAIVDTKGCFLNKAIGDSRALEHETRSVSATEYLPRLTNPSSRVSGYSGVQEIPDSMAPGNSARNVSFFFPLSHQLSRVQATQCGEQ